MAQWKAWEELGARADRLRPRVAAGCGVAVGAGLGVGLGLGGGWGVAAAVGLGGLVAPWAVSGRPVLRSRVGEARPRVEPVSAPRRRMVVLETPRGRVEVPVVDLPGGVFQMGSERGNDDEKPVHGVRLPPFAIMEVPVTRGLVGALRGEAVPEDVAEVPVVDVSWFDAVALCNLASAQAGLAEAYEIDGRQIRWRPEASGFRLPMEAEWEYAVRAGPTKEFFFGDDDPGEYAWFADPERGTPDGAQPVRGKKRNPWGLYDMAGNVWEWCWDAWNDNYNDHVARMTLDPFFNAGPDVVRVQRGGAFNDSAVRLRSAGRDGVPAGGANGDTGVRCVLGARPPDWAFWP